MYQFLMYRKVTIYIYTHSKVTQLCIVRINTHTHTHTLYFSFSDGLSLNPGSSSRINLK